jgi:hypothetical protein
VQSRRARSPARDPPRSQADGARVVGEQARRLGNRDLQRFQPLEPISRTDLKLSVSGMRCPSVVAHMPISSLVELSSHDSSCPVSIRVIAKSGACCSHCLAVNEEASRAHQAWTIHDYSGSVQTHEYAILKLHSSSPRIPLPLPAGSACSGASHPRTLVALLRYQGQPPRRPCSGSGRHQARAGRE